VALKRHNLKSGFKLVWFTQVSLYILFLLTRHINTLLTTRNVQWHGFVIAMIPDYYGNL